MSKIALKITRKLLDFADRVYDRIEAARIKALINELKAIIDRGIERQRAEVADINLRRAVQAELALLENDDD
jgi:hypothetical protein